MGVADEYLLPEFLQPWPTPRRATPLPIDASYSHGKPFGQTQVLWWPWRTQGSVPHTVLLFIPGNPGLLDFYVPFLNAIHEATAKSSVAILAHGHLGLISYVGGDRAYLDPSSVMLPAQIQAHVRLLDDVVAAYGADTRVLFVGHSVGSWFIQQVLKARPALRPRVGAFMLFPTISHIGSTPSGRLLSPVFRPPWPRAITYLSFVVRHVPLSVLGMIERGWPCHQLQVLHDFLQAPAAIYSAFTMANDEMETVRELDTAFLREFAEDLWFYYAEEDKWVGEQREVVLRALGETPVSASETRVVRGRNEVPHAFCINHSEEIAAQCVDWMQAGGFLRLDESVGGVDKKSF
ncbi:hypothetical protein BC834DRAFT_879350 [Gloeopeniophorella convolvens]|nr:hypothetical protein BC834DRAFT_879350 [Gloeopeniophorella convolvens]